MSQKFSKGIIQLGGDVRYLQQMAPSMEPDEREAKLQEYSRILNAVYDTAEKRGIDLIPYYNALADVEANLKIIRGRTHDSISVEKIALFIDAANLSIMCRDCLRRDIDYEKLLVFFSENSSIQQAYYYTAVENERDLYTNSFYFALKKIGYYLVTKPLKIFANGEKKGNLDIEIALDMLECADKVDRVVLFSGDGDFAPLLEQMRRKGVKTEVVSYTNESRNPTAAELIFAADIVTNLADIIDKFTLTKKH